MQRVTIRVPGAHVDRIEELVDAGVYANRSEAIRDAIRHRLKLLDTSGSATAHTKSNTETIRRQLTRAASRSAWTSTGGTPKLRQEAAPTKRRTPGMPRGEDFEGLEIGVHPEIEAGRVRVELDGQSRLLSPARVRSLADRVETHSPVVAGVFREAANYVEDHES